MNILKHPIYKAIYDLCHEIEKLPASEQQTKVVMMASALEKPADELFDRSEHLAGVWECPKCNFVLQKSILSTRDGNIYANNEPFVERCPNDGQIMAPLTLKKAYSDLIVTCEKQIKRAYDAEQERDQLRKEIIACLDLCPNAVRVCEGGGLENIAASLAVTMANLTGGK